MNIQTNSENRRSQLPQIVYVSSGLASPRVPMCIQEEVVDDIPSSFVYSHFHTSGKPMIT